MIIKTRHVNIDKSAVITELDFELSDDAMDVGLLFDTLRSKMYSRPLESMIREILSNARDANDESAQAETGDPLAKSSVPVRVKLPSRLDPSLHITDSGPGISPERMSIFVKFGKSTKRATNGLTGGYGYGAKTPFAYSDTFSVVTVTDGVRRHYTAYIDETLRGKVALTEESATDQPNGTTIIIPIKPEDFTSVATKVVSLTKYWSLKPTLSGTHPIPEYPKEKIFLSGTGWAIIETRTDSRGYRYDSSGRDAVAVIDGIAYTIPSSAFSELSEEESLLLHKNTIMYFDVGDLALSTNREHIHFDEATRLKIRERLAETAAGAYAKAIKKIEEQVSLGAAEWFWHEFQTEFGSMSKRNGDSPVWRGFPLLGVRRANGDLGAKIESFSIKAGRRGGRTLRRTEVNHLILNANCHIFVNDLRTNYGLRSRVKHYLESIADGNGAESSLTRTIVQVITFTSDLCAKRWEEEHSFSQLGAKSLSLLSNPKPQPRTGASSGRRGPRRTTIDVWEHADSYWKSGVTLDKTQPVVGCFVVMADARTKAVYSDEIKLDAGHLMVARQFLNKPLYAIKKRDLNVVLSLGLEPFHIAIKTALSKVVGELDGWRPDAINFVVNKKYSNAAEMLTGGIKDLHSPWLEYVKACGGMDDSEKHYRNIQILDSVRRFAPALTPQTKGKSSIELFYDETVKRYPMLKQVIKNSWQPCPPEVLVEYINQIDELHTLKKDLDKLRVAC